MYLKNTLFACLAVGMISQTASAALLAYEGFDYPNDGSSIMGRNGGTGWVTAWEDDDMDFNMLSQDETSLSSPAYPFVTTGDRVLAQQTTGSTREVNRSFGTGIDLSQDGNTLYASWLWRKDSDNATSAENIEFDLGSSVSPTRIRVGSGSGETWLVRFGSNNGGVGSIPLGETLYTVLKLTSSATSDDVLEVITYGTSDTVPLSEPLTWDMSAATSSSEIIDVARMWIGVNVDGGMDEIRIGTTWADVAGVPEPTSVTMITMGCLAILAGRRRCC